LFLQIINEKIALFLPQQIIAVGGDLELLNWWSNSR
jgi:hypothetical protein